MPEQPEWGITISKYFIIPQRVILALMGLFGIMTAYAMRVCLSVVILELVIKKESHNNSGQELDCPDEPSSVSNNDAAKAEYEWTEEQQGLILSSFYWGYIITHIPGGILADKFGGKWTLGVGVLITSLTTLLTPLAIYNWDATGLIIFRVVMGLGQGTSYPALTVLVSQWVPRKERSTLGSLVMGGGQLGTIFGNSVSGLLLDAFHWEWTFYFHGCVGLLWFILFICLCYKDPGSHPFIKPSEKEYLIREMGSIGKKTNIAPIPWLAIMTNIPMIALILAQIGHDWGFFIMVTDLPKYMGDVLRFSIKENGLYSSLPYIMMWIVSIASGLFGDWMTRKNILSLTNIRKLFTAIAAFGPAAFMVLASYAGCDRLLVVALFIIAMGLMGTFYAGMKLSPIDMSPNYSGTLMAIANGLGAITGIVSPYLVGVMTPNASLMEWRLVFWLAFIILSSTCVVYIFFASAEVQPFNDISVKERKPGDN